MPPTCFFLASSYSLRNINITQFWSSQNNTMNFWKSWRSKFGTVHISRLKDYYEIASIHWHRNRWNFLNISLYLYTRTYTHNAFKKTRSQAHILTHNRKLLIHDFNDDQISIRRMAFGRFDIWCFDIWRIDIRLISIQRDGIRQIGIRRIGILQTHIRWIGVWQIGIRRIGIRRISFQRICLQRIVIRRMSDSSFGEAAFGEWAFCEWRIRRTVIHKNGRIPLARHQFHKRRKRGQVPYFVFWSNKEWNRFNKISNKE